MATKPETKSKIPLKVAKKEMPSERTRMTFGNCNYPKPTINKENRNKTKPFKHTVDNTAKPTRNLKALTHSFWVIIFFSLVTDFVFYGTTKEQLKGIPQDSKPKQPVRSDIETLSQDLVNRLKTDDNITNPIPKIKDGTSSKTTGPKKSTSPSALVKPKNYLPHSGLMLKPAVKKSTVAVKPFNIKVNPPKMRRSISEYDFKFVRPKVESIQPQHNDKNIKEKDRNIVGQKCAKTTKSETLSNLKKIDKKPPKEFPAHHQNPVSTGRMSKQFPVDKTSAKAAPSKPKPLRRSITMHAFDSVPILKKGKVSQTNKSPLSKTVPEIANLGKGRTPVTPENSKLEMPLSENLRAHFTPKKEIPHVGLVMNRNAARISKTKINAFANVQ